MSTLMEDELVSRLSVPSPKLGPSLCLELPFYLLFFNWGDKGLSGLSAYLEYIHVLHRKGTCSDGQRRHNLS